MFQGISRAFQGLLNLSVSKNSERFQRVSRTYQRMSIGVSGLSWRFRNVFVDLSEFRKMLEAFQCVSKDFMRFYNVQDEYQNTSICVSRSFKGF